MNRTRTTGHGAVCRSAAAFLATAMVVLALAGVFHFHGPLAQPGPRPLVDLEPERHAGPLSCPACRFSNQQALPLEHPDGLGTTHEAPEISLPTPFLLPQEVTRSTQSPRAPPALLPLSA